LCCGRISCVNLGLRDISDSVASGVAIIGSPNFEREGDRSCTDSVTTSVTSGKRKGSLPTFGSTAESSEKQIEAGLTYVTSVLKSAMNEAKLEGEKSGSSLFKLLEDMYDTVAPMLTKKGKLRSPLHPSVKKLKEDMTSGPLGRSIDKPEIVDVGTDIVLTPNWWESEQERRKKESSRHRSTKASSRGLLALATHTDTGADSSMDTDGEGWREVVGRKTTAVPLSRTLIRQLILPMTGVKPTLG